MSTNPTTTRPKPRKHLTELRTRRDEAKTPYVISADAEIPGHPKQRPTGLRCERFALIWMGGRSRVRTCDPLVVSEVLFR